LEGPQAGVKRGSPARKKKKKQSPNKEESGSREEESAFIKASNKEKTSP